MTDKKKKSATPAVSQPLPSSNKRNSYLKTLQGKGINAISALSTRGIRKSYEEKYNKMMTVGGEQGTLPGFEDKIQAEVTVEKSDVTFVINHPMNHAFNGRTEQVLWYLIYRLTHAIKPWSSTPGDMAECRKIKLFLNEMCGTFGLKDAKSAKETLESALWTLRDTEIRWTEQRYQKVEGSSGKGKPVGTVKWTAPIISKIGIGEDFEPQEPKKLPAAGAADDGTGTDETTQQAEENGKKKLKNPVAFRRGYLIVELSEALTENLVTNNYTMYIPERVFLINPTYYRNSVSLAFKLMDHYNQNINSKNKHTLTVSTLMEYAQDLPTYDEVINNGKHVYQQIIRPFIRDLLYLQEFGILKDCYFYEDIKTPIPKDELKNYKYDDFIKLKVHFEFLQHPGRTNNDTDDYLPPDEDTTVAV